MLLYCLAHPNQPREASVTQRRPNQFDLFENIDPPGTLPTAISEESFMLLVQLLHSMIPVIETEVGNEQDIH